MRLSASELTGAVNAVNARCRTTPCHSRATLVPPPCGRYGGCGANFTTSCLVIEELAKIDPAVSAGVDVHNTVVNNTIMMWGSDDIKERFLPGLAADHFGSFCKDESSAPWPASWTDCAFVPESVDIPIYSIWGLTIGTRCAFIW